MKSLRDRIIAAIEHHCSEGTSGGIIGADDAADEILEAIEAEEGPEPGAAMTREEAQAETTAQRRQILNRLAMSLK